MVTKGNLTIDDDINRVVQSAANDAGIDADRLYASFENIIRDMAPRNTTLLEQRERFQEQINQYFAARKGQQFDAASYTAFLKDIGYIVPEGRDFKVGTTNVDKEFTTAGPQLVCPAFIGENTERNARYPLNAVNARWRSLYDAVYGQPGDKNIIDEGDGKEFKFDAGGKPVYNAERGAAVVGYVNKELDKSIPLEGAKYDAVNGFIIRAGKVFATLDGGGEAGLKDPGQFAGFTGSVDKPASLLFEKNGLHTELQLDRSKAKSKSGIRDVIHEAALTTIIDLEDSLDAVDARDKVLAYRNVDGLLKGNLKAKMEDEKIRGLNEDRAFNSPDGKNSFILPGRSKMLFRRVGLHMYTDAVTYQGKEIPEGFLDTLMIALSSIKDLKKKKSELRNSETGSVYIVMPKQHGPEEVKFTAELFDRIEQALGLTKNTLKIGIMDEEQRTSVNLKECIRAAGDRIVFINTGFLDRTGDLIHTAMEGGALDTKDKMKAAGWLDAYEKSNVQVGLATGLQEAGQIGKGMWTQNRNPKGLVDTKDAQPKAGATTAWVPDPKGAVLHALHYEKTNVSEVQEGLMAKGNEPIDKAKILEAPFMTEALKPDEKEKILYGYAQSILGYVVRWVNQGIGCSSVPDHTGTPLMEDRATLRIGSQLLSNWLRHGVISEDELNVALKNAAETVDKQNAKDKGYTPLVGNYDGPAFQAAEQLIHLGQALPNGYVEPVLNAARRTVKERENGAYVGGDHVGFIFPDPSSIVANPHLSGSERKIRIAI